MKTIWTQSGVNRRKEPFVQLFMDDEIITQFSPAEARAFAHTIIEAAEASEQDAFLITWLGTINEELAGKSLIEFRKFREATGKKGPPSSAAEFVRTDKHQKPDDYVHSSNCAMRDGKECDCYEH